MEKERGQTTERILNLTLEIIYLLTGENYIAFKLSDGLVTSNLMKNQIPDKEPLSHSLSKDNKKIREFTKEIIDLLAGEDLGDIEGPQDLFKNIMTENPTLTSPDGSRSTPERCPHPLYSRASSHEDQQIHQEDQVGGHEGPITPPERCPCPLYSQDPTQEDQEIPQDDQDEDNFFYGAETREEAEESSVIGEEQCKEEEIPPEISTEIEDNRDTQRDVGAKEEVNHVTIKEEEIPPEINTDGQYISNDMENHPVLYPDCELEDEEDIISHYTKENHILPNLLSPSHGAGMSPGPSTQRAWLSDNYYATAHQEDQGCPKSIPCPECGKCFSEKSKLTTHRRSHTGEKPFTCLECGKSFKQSAHLVSHNRTHTRVHPFSCFECGKCFSQKSNLIRHEKVHTGEKSFSCPVCGKRFSEKSNLIRHEKIHTGEKPYSCSECGRCFSLRGNLIAHVRTHTGEKPFACSVCGKSFTRKSVLIIHERVHTGEKPYSCNDCGKYFSKRFLLARHARLHAEQKSFSQPAIHSLPKEPIPFSRGLTEVINRYRHHAADSFHENPTLSPVSLPATDRRYLRHNVADE